MNTVTRHMMRLGNRMGVSLYRRSGGRVGGRGADRVPVLLLTVPGRRSGRLRTTPVGYFDDHDGGYLVVGSGGGMAHDPDWFRNLRAAPTADVEMGRKSFSASVTELTGEQRDRAFSDVVVARSPRFARYEKKSGRAMPVARLVPRA
jgi:deazaflavin-dependent oxidoreductase (nitroreductase family)